MIAERKPIEIQVITQRQPDGTFGEKPITVRFEGGDLRYFTCLDVIGPSWLAMTPERKRVVLFTHDQVKEAEWVLAGTTTIQVHNDRDRHDRIVRPSSVNGERFDEVTIHGRCQLRLTEDRKQILIHTLAKVEGKNTF